MTTRKNIDIEVLRAFAIMGTLWAHLDILYFWGSDTYHAINRVISYWGGVDLFFVISGFVITGSLLRAKETARSFRAFAIPFWVRRFWRIVPSAWVWLAIVLVASTIFTRTVYLGDPRGNLNDALWSVAQLANLHFWQTFAGITTIYGTNQVYWSLSLEEQCYLIIPFAIYFASTRRAEAILWLVILLQIGLSRPPLGFLWFFRTDALAFGALIALAHHRNAMASIEPTALRNPYLAWSTFVLMVIVYGLIGGSAAGTRLITTYVAIAAAAFVWIASYGRGYTMPDGIIRRGMTYLGSRSYAIYLVHIPVYRGLHEATADIPTELIQTPVGVVAYAACAIAIVLAIAEINYRFLETPLRFYGASVADRYAIRANQSAEGVGSVDRTTSGSEARNVR